MTYVVSMADKNSSKVLIDEIDAESDDEAIDIALEDCPFRKCDTHAELKTEA